MSTVFAIETSSSRSSVALLRGDGKLFSWDGDSGQSHNEELALGIEKILNDAGVQADTMTRIVYGVGPGSFTGLRIGLSVIKGIAHVHKIPIVPISSLKCMAGAADRGFQLIGAYADARREEVFLGIYAKQGGKLVAVEDDSIVKISEVPDRIEEAKNRLKIDSNATGLVCADELPALLSCGITHAKVANLAASLLCLDAENGAPRDDFSTVGLSQLSPHYLRRVAAKSIAERAAEAGQK